MKDYYGYLYRQIVKIYSKIPYLLNSCYAFPPLQVFLELTYRCNLRCKMCQFLPIIDRREKDELNLNEIKKIVDQIPKYTLITLTGGEPFLRNDIFEIIDYIAKNHRCHIITNGTFLTPENAERLVNFSSFSLLTGGLFFLGVSLQGLSEVHERITQVKGSYQKTLEGIRKIQEYKKIKKKTYPLIHITLVITQENLSQLLEVWHLVRELGVDVCNFTLYNTSPLPSCLETANIEERIEEFPPSAPILDSEILSNQLKEIIKEGKESKTAIRLPRMPLSKIIKYYQGEPLLPKDYICYSPWSKVTISPFGEVYPCYRIRAGNIKEKKMRYIWNGQTFRRFRQKLRKKGIFAGCSGCCELEYRK